MRRERVTQLGLGLLALTELFPGVWGTIDPHGFYEELPTPEHRWLTYEPPYNEHLVRDAAAGFLAIGVVLLLVTVLWRERRARQVALVAYLVGTVPHAVHHLTHRADAMPTLDVVLSAGGLTLGCAVAAWLLYRLRT